MFLNKYLMKYKVRHRRYWGGEIPKFVICFWKCFDIFMVLCYALVQGMKFSLGESLNRLQQADDFCDSGRGSIGFF